MKAKTKETSLLKKTLDIQLFTQNTPTLVTPSHKKLIFLALKKRRNAVLNNFQATQGKTTS